MIDRYKTLSSKIQISRWRHCRDSERTSRSLNEHQAILHALLEGDADQAVLCLRKHIGAAKEDLINDSDHNSYKDEP